jgi:putative two-component system response regulator
MNLAAALPGRVLLVGATDSAPDVAAVLAAHPWQCAHAATSAGVLRRLHTVRDIDLVVLVPNGEFREYTELCRQIKFDQRTAFVAVLFALPAEYADRRFEAYAAGADDCLPLPASPQELGLRLSRAFQFKRATDSLEDASAILSSLANAVEGRDAYTRGHTERVSAYAVEIGRHIGLDPGSFPTLRIGGIVHDIGKVAVPDQILNKPGKLTDAEFDAVRRHPLVGFDVLRPVRTFRAVLPIVRWHHERPNGKGYPDGLQGDQLPLLPRIVAVADVFDALSTARPYRPAFSVDEYTDILRRSADHGDLDPVLVAALLEILRQNEVTLAGGTLDPALLHATPQRPL